MKTLDPAMKQNLYKRNFLTLLDYTPEEIQFLLDLAHNLKEEKRAGERKLRLAGKTSCCCLKNLDPHSLRL